MKMPEVLTRKIGPLPAGVWVLAIGGGIGVAVLVRRGATDSEAVAEAYEAGEQAAADSIASDSGWDQPDPGGTNPGVGGSDYFDWYDGTDDLAENEPDDPTVWLPDPMPAPVSPPTAAAAGAEPPAVGSSGQDYITAARQAGHNNGWRNNVKAALVQRGYRGGLVDQAFNRWWAGRDLTGAQAGVVSTAVAIAGAPPNPPSKRVDNSGTLPANGGGHGGGGGRGKHKWEPKSRANRKCKHCNRWRDNEIHTNRG